MSTTNLSGIIGVMSNNSGLLIQQEERLTSLLVELRGEIPVSARGDVALSGENLSGAISRADKLAMETNQSIERVDILISELTELLS